MSTGRRLAVLGAVIVVATAGILVARGGSSSSTKAPTSANVTIDVKNAKPVGGIKEIELKLGGTLHLTVHSDTADEVHVHATDQHEDVAKGGTVSMTIKPPAAGTSEIELENHHVHLASLTVEP